METKFKLNLWHIYIFLLMLLPIINSYRLLPIAFIYFFCVMGIVFAMISHKNISLRLKSNHFIYFIYVLVMSLVIMAGQQGITISEIAIRLTYFALIFFNFYILAYQTWDFNFAIKIYKNICLIVSVLMIIQFLLSSMGRPICLIPSGMIANTGDRLSTNTIRALQIAGNRFSTFFLEPAHQAQYVVPCIAILLFSDMLSIKKKDLIISIVLTIGVIATTSMQGILLCGFIWMIYLYELMKLRGSRKIGRLIFLIPLLITVLIYFLQQPIIQNQFLKKTMSINQGIVSKGTSMYRRINYGWDCYREFDLVHKIIGCGYDNVSNYLYTTGIGLQYVSYEQIGYMSGLSEMFCEIGIVGSSLNFSITIFVIINNMRKNKMVTVLLITWLGLMLSSSVFDGLASLIPLTFMMDATMKRNAGNQV